MNEEIAKNLFNEIKSDENEDFTICEKTNVIIFYKNVRKALFINYYENKYDEKDVFQLLDTAKYLLIDAFYVRPKKLENEIDEIYSNLGNIRKDLMLDIQAIYDGDPAANSIGEIILTYPGFVAISAYRIAHEFYLIGEKIIARIISEFAHSQTGIDINPGAQIGKSFFIDHGTGIVIGETAVIGNNVKIYQGVTLGALSLEDGHKLKDIKRHPTIGNNVTIYANATILGGDTYIGDNSVIGGGVFITKSVSNNSVCRYSSCEICEKDDDLI